MSIITYDELKIALANYSHRTDATNRIPEFIQMGEADLNARVRTAEQEIDGSLTCSTLTREIALPSGFLEARKMMFTADLEEIFYDDSLQENTESARPKRYTIRDTIRFDYVPDSAYALTFFYRRKYDIASDSTNWLLTNWPNAYLYASLYHMAIWAKDVDGAMTYNNILGNIIADINRQEARKRAKGTLKTNVPNLASSFNIFRG